MCNSSMSHKKVLLVTGARRGLGLDIANDHGRLTVIERGETASFREAKPAAVGAGLELAAGWCARTRPAGGIGVR
jgi:NAD(P)-dependent dehydrogenase (short-subunit alcohol dehydrogenase family)